MTLRQVQFSVREPSSHYGDAPNDLAVVSLTYDGTARFAGRLYRGVVGDETAAERAFRDAEATGKRCWIETPAVRGVQRGNERTLSFREVREP